MKESADTPADEIYEIGKAGEVTFFFRSEPEGRTEEYLGKIAPVYQKEYSTLRKALEEALKNAEYAEPSVPGSILVGSTLDFETVDVDGNPVRSIDLFRNKKITMINFWTTTCINCQNEMADLVEINKRLAEKNAAIIGVCLDADTEPEACRESWRNTKSISRSCFHSLARKKHWISGLSRPPILSTARGRSFRPPMWEPPWTGRDMRPISTVCSTGKKPFRKT